MNITALWDAINEYAQACGGDTSAHTMSPRRMAAVVAVERVILGPPAVPDSPGRPVWDGEKWVGPQNTDPFLLCRRAPSAGFN